MIENYTVITTKPLITPYIPANSLSFRLYGHGGTAGWTPIGSSELSTSTHFYVVLSYEAA